MTGRVMRKTAMPRGRPPRPRRLRQRRKRRRSRRRRKSSVVTAQDVREAAAGLAGVAVRTPLRFIETLNVYLKLESLQPIGAFKLRGAYNAVRRLPEAARRNGVITYSSGNHGQALAYAAQLVGVRAVVVMPETAPAVKVAGVKKWGGEVVLAGRTSDDRQRAAEAIAVREGLAVVPPFDHPDIVAGQATVGLEIAEQLPDGRLPCHDVRMVERGHHREPLPHGDGFGGALAIVRGATGEHHLSPPLLYARDLH